MTSDPTTLEYLYSLVSPSACTYLDLHLEVCVLAHLPQNVANSSFLPPSLLPSQPSPIYLYATICIGLPWWLRW